MNLMDEMEARLQKIGKDIHGMNVGPEVNAYIDTCRDVWQFAEKISAHNRHLSFVPMVNELNQIDASRDPRVWLMVYRALSVMTDYPVEAFNALSLRMKKGTEGYVIEFNGTTDATNTDGECEEPIYGFALAGVEEDWWDIDDLPQLPSRKKAVLKAIEANSGMTEFTSFMTEMFDEGDGEEEGGFAGEWAE